MDDVVALALQLESGREAYVLTWGRLHHPVDPLPLAHVILRHAPQLSLETHVTGVRLCDSLREAAVAPRFFECLVALSREQVVRGRGYPAWRRHKIALLDLGKDIWFAGVADVADLPPPDLRSTDPVSAQEFNHEPPSPFDRPTSVEPRHWATDRLECHVWIWSGSAWSPTMPEAVEFSHDCCSQHRMVSVDAHHIACEGCGLTTGVSPADEGG